MKFMSQKDDSYFGIALEEIRSQNKLILEKNNKSHKPEHRVDKLEARA
jgi:hypothetical protein